VGEFFTCGGQRHKCSLPNFSELRVSKNIEIGTFVTELIHTSASVELTQTRHSHST